MSVRNKIQKLIGITKYPAIYRSPLSFLKWSLDTFRQKETLSRQPLHLHIEPTTRCNLRCTMCEHTYWKEKKIDLSLKQFKDIIDKVPHAASVDLTGIGEGILNPEFEKIISYAKEKGIRVRFNTNATLLNPTWVESIVSLGIDEVHVSVDGASKETFESIREGAKLETVLANLALLNEEKQKQSKSFPSLHIICIAMNDTIHEIPELLHIASERGVAYVDIQGMIEFESNENMKAKKLTPSETQAVFEKSQKLAQELNIHLALPSIKEKKTACYHPWFQSYILSDGTVLPCCLYGQRNNRDELKNELSFGNIFKEDFNVIWNNQKYRDLRKMLKSGKLTGLCKECPIPKGQF